jgi:hypothetical protein
MDINEIGCEGMDCIDQIQDTVQWQALSNMVLNVYIVQKWGISCIVSEYNFLKDLVSNNWGQ